MAKNTEICANFEPIEPLSLPKNISRTHAFPGKLLNFRFTLPQYFLYNRLRDKCSMYRKKGCVGSFLGTKLFPCTCVWKLSIRARERKKKICSIANKTTKTLKSSLPMVGAFHPQISHISTLKTFRNYLFSTLNSLVLVRLRERDKINKQAFYGQWTTNTCFDLTHFGLPIIFGYITARMLPDQSVPKRNIHRAAWW
jgi:hypothetical protein